ncbi:MAG TPA: carboxypeptidase regulatory-like domain-containing protein [Bryobacteraceae bacterium]|nr:carboxypeptidase regulatory-like domain-containing protein [Bryobacteraceae bacterium]
MVQTQTDKHRHAIVCLFLIAFLISLPVFAQEVTGNILGIVSDASGAAIPNATVTVTHVERNQVVRELTTNESGAYLAPLLPLGRYDVAVEGSGFKRTVQRGLEVNASDRVTANFTLEVGDLAQEISVEAPAVQVETATAQQQGLISGTMVRELALNNRHFAQLLVLQPGVVTNTSDSMFVGTTNPSGGNNTVGFSINGQRQSSNNFTVDGADITDRGSNVTIINYPSIDAIEEVRVVRSAYSSEFGRSAGGQINIVTRSGTSAFHGSAYEFFRNDKLNANSFLNNANRVVRPPLRYNNFGYTLGGPVTIPGLYNKERNKTFFFWSQEFRRVTNYTSGNSIVPTAEELQGRFSRPVCVGPVTDVCSQQATQITTINPVARAYIQDVWSKIPTSPDNNLFVPVRGVFNSRQDLIRVDHNFGTKLNLAVRFLNDSIPTEEPRGLFTNGALPGVHNTRTNSPGRTWVFRGTSTFSPTMYNEAGVTYSRAGIVSEPTGLAASANSPNVQVNLPFPSTLARIPTLVYTGGASTITSYGPYDNKSSNYSVFDNLSWSRGNHNLKFGGLWNQYRKKENAASANAGSFTFAGTPAPAGTTTFQQSWANFLLGNVASYTQTSLDLTPDLKMNGLEFYLQDDWRIRPRLTLNLGVRYSNFFQPYEAGDLLSNFDPASWDPNQAPLIDPATGLIIPNTGNPLNGIIYAEGRVPQGGLKSPYGRKIGAEDNNNFAPRIGLAWDVFGTGVTSVRAGYGMFYDTQLIGIYQTNITTNPPVLNTNITNTRLENPSSGTVQVSASPLALRGTPVDYNTPYAQQWSLDVQHEVLRNLILTVGYVGSKGTNLLGAIDINAVPPGAAAAAGLVPAPTPTNAGYITATNIARLNALRPYRGYGPINVIRTWFNSNYNSLQVSAQKRFAGGALINLAYTWSKALTDNGSDRSNSPQNTYAWEQDYGLSPLDRRHVLNIAYVYELPFFRAQEGFVGRVLGGWQVSGITLWQTGTPLTITSTRGFDYAGMGTAQATSTAQVRPDVVSDPNSGFTRDRFQFFNTAAFADAPPGGLRPGNAGRSIITGPSITRFDFSLFKNIRLAEQVRLQLRGEAFNVLNHTNFDTIGTSFGTTATFGRVTAVRDPRNIQLGAKLTF